VIDWGEGSTVAVILEELSKLADVDVDDDPMKSLASSFSNSVYELQALLP
jgi:hypothetical protein